MGTVANFLQSRQPVQIDLLTEFPLNTDPSTWKIVSWEGYKPGVSIPQVTFAFDQMVGGYCDCYFFLDQSKIAQIQAVGITFGGQYVFHGNFQQTILDAGFIHKMRVGFLCQPWYGT